MEREDVRQAIAVERRELADLLEGLSAEDWERPSLCGGWRVRDVAAHLAVNPQVRPLSGMVELARARGSINRMIHDTAVRHAGQPTGQLVAELREYAESARRPPGTNYLDPLQDILVHGQDIAVPLGVRRGMPLPAARTAAGRIWAMGFPFKARRRFQGLRFVATDTEW